VPLNSTHLACKKAFRILIAPSRQYFGNRDIKAFEVEYDYNTFLSFMNNQRKLPPRWGLAPQHAAIVTKISALQAFKNCQNSDTG